MNEKIKDMRIVEFIECPKCLGQYVSKFSLTCHLKRDHKFSKDQLDEFKHDIRHLRTLYQIEVAKRQRETTSTICENGLTKAQNNANKSAHTMKNTITENGLTVYENAFLKMAKTKYEDIDSTGLNGHQRGANKSAITKAETIDENGLNIHQQTGICVSKYLNAVDEFGVSNAKKIGIKIIETVTTIIGEDGLTIAQRVAKKGGETSRTTILDNGLTIAQNAAINAVVTKLRNDPDIFRKTGRKALITRITKNGRIFCPAIGNNETKILDEIERVFSISLIRQKHICGFWVDGYCEELNTVFEVYEKYHFSEHQIERDNYRQQCIISSLNCNFIIIREDEYLRNPMMIENLKIYHPLELLVPLLSSWTISDGSP